jgi:opacity protein-like surface antigen
MKKIVLSAVAVLAFGFAKAQDVKFGAKAGLNISSISGESDSKSKAGLALGVFAEIKVSDKFSVQPEVLYSVLGAKSNGSSDKVNLAYINIPVMAKYYVADKFSLEAGPQIGFLTSAKYVQGSNSINLKEGYKSTDFGLNFGAGYDVTKNIGVGVRYTAGLSNIVKDNGGDKVRNNNFAIALAYRF